MPFELGIDFGCRQFGGDPLDSKTVLILEHSKYEYQKALSDIAGWDIEAHDGDRTNAIRCVANWLVRHAGATPVGASKILGQYDAFQEWYWKRERDNGSSPEDITAYPTIYVIEAMREWVGSGRPDGAPTPSIAPAPRSPSSSSRKHQRVPPARP